MPLEPESAQYHSCAGANLAALHRGVADFLEKLHIACGGGSLLRAGELVHGLDSHEQDEGHDHEADHVVDDQPNVYGGGTGSCGHERLVMLAVQRNENAAEVDAAGDDADRQQRPRAI